jgi:hypothetical protein
VPSSRREAIDPLILTQLPPGASVGLPGAVKPQLLADYLTLQIEALKAEKRERGERARIRERNGRLIRQFAAPAIWVLGLLLVGALMVGLGSRQTAASMARVTGEHFHFFGRLVGAWKFAGLPVNFQDALKNLAPYQEAIAHWPSKLAVVGTIPGFNQVMNDGLAFLVPAVITAAALQMQSALRKEAGAVIGMLLGLPLLVTFIATALAFRHAWLSAALVVVAVALGLLLIDRMAVLAIESVPPAPRDRENQRWLASVGERYRLPAGVAHAGAISRLLLHPFRHRLIRAVFLAVPVVANTCVIVAFTERDLGSTQKWDALWSHVEVGSMLLFAAWVLWACLAGLATRPLFVPFTGRALPRVFIAAPFVTYAIAAVALYFALRASSLMSYSALAAFLSSWTFVVFGLGFVMWGAWASIRLIVSANFLHPWRARRKLFLGLLAASLLGTIVSAIFLSGDSTSSVLSMSVTLAFVISGAVLVLWFLWLIAAVIDWLGVAHPAHSRRGLVAFLGLSAFSLLAMALGWEGASRTGSWLFQLGAIFSIVWCVITARMLLRGHRRHDPSEKPAMMRLFSVLPLLALVVAVLASGVITVPDEIGATLPGFLWAFILITAVVVYVGWCVWAWLVVPTRLRPLLTPLLLALIVGIIFGTTAFEIAVAFLLAVAVPTFLARTYADPAGLAAERSTSS